MQSAMAGRVLAGRAPAHLARRVLAALVVVALWAALAPGGASASTSIRLVVNDQPITNYDIAQRARLIRLTSPGGNARAAAEDELINETLQMQEAERTGVRVADRQIDAALGDIASRIGISRSQLLQALRQEGVNPDTLRDRLRAQIAWGQVIQRRFNASTAVTEQDLVAALREQGSEEGKETVEYTLQQVIAVVPRGGEAAARRRAADLRRRFTSCEEGLQLAREAPEIVVRPFGQRLETELTPQMREVLDGIAVGRLTEPVEQREGLIMFAVCGKRQVRSTAAAMQEIERDLRSERGEQFAQQYLRTLRRDALVERR